MKITHFNVETVTNDLVKWIRDWFDKTATENTNAIIGISGGKDSTIAAALLVKALGPSRVIGVAMPNTRIGQGLYDADKICEYLGIRFYSVDISTMTERVYYEIYNGTKINLSTQAELNVGPRIRMTVLYSMGQTLNARVVNTGNLSENYIGYSTKYGDSAGDFAPLANLTVTEILKIGDYLGLPHEWVHRTPDDGLPYSCPDEEKFGFTYKQLDEYLRYGICEDTNLISKIETMHKQNLHKLEQMPTFNLIY